MTNIHFPQATTDKAKQFTSELNALLERYQYSFDAELSVTTKGLTPVLVLKDVIPAKTQDVTPTPQMVEDAKKLYKEKHGDK